ncbi:MAG: cobyrinate a,c-diamide synthase, partial [Candidatus Syntrophonatronum acetioxidans]
MSRFIIAGTHSGVGKTTITAALIRALTRRGLKVQPFKVGPDYIDPGYHNLASGRQTRNLDGWMLREGQVKEILGRNSPPGVTGVIEGVMGLFDGYSSRGEEGSTAHIAKITGTPVVLIIDGSKMARSAGAVALGYKTMDREVSIRGIIFNRLGSENHYRILKEAVEFLEVPVLGYLPRDMDSLLPERHLGLVPTTEMEEVEEFLDYWSEKVEEFLDLETLLDIAASAGEIEMPRQLTLPYLPDPGESFCNLAVARDRA